MISCPVTIPKGRTTKDQIQIYLQQGYSKIWDQNKVKDLDHENISENSALIIDRIKNDDNPENQSRILDSLELAFHEGKGTCNIIHIKEDKSSLKSFNNLFIKDGIVFEEPSLDFFSFNSPYGACKKCEGFGKVMGIDSDLVIPNPNLSIYDNAIVCWKGEKMSVWKEELILNSHHFNFPIHEPIRNLSKDNLELIWEGNQYFRGLNSFFKYLESKSYKIQYRVMLSRYRGKTTCNSCNGTRLRADANYVKVGQKSISDINNMTISNALSYFKNLKLNQTDAQIAKRIVHEISSRLNYLSDVGLGYLTLMRASNTLSGGESQRINLATSIGSSLVGSMYILDEPSIGLHTRDSQKLIKVLKRLRDVGNTVIVVEHDEEMMKSADMIIDIGPEAGRHGGEIVFKGTHDQLISSKKSLTARYLSGKLSIEVPKVRRKPKDFIIIEEAYLHNLKNISVKIPLNQICVITGVSGSGNQRLLEEFYSNF